MNFVGLLRHGETEGGNVYRGWHDDPMTSTGWRQMKISTTRLTHWDQIISSPLQRCSSFAKRFAQTHAIPYKEDARLMEIHFGQWEGYSAKQIMATSPTELYISGCRFECAGLSAHPPTPCNSKRQSGP